MARFHLNQPLTCLSKLIEQPTWGGRFILELKGLASDPDWQGKKVGQSFELYGGTTVKVGRQQASLANLLAEHGREILGQELYERVGPKMPILLKLTQAKGNSYQIHIKPGHHHSRWRPKAEAWYYFETGLITMGIREGADWRAYERTVRAIAKEMEKLSRKVSNQRLSLAKARKKAQQLISDYQPNQFVNQITAQPGEVWDLSACGLHHSWEEDEKLAPKGNLVYEIQDDQPDEISSIRCFDKGKLKDDGRLREIHPEDYFQFIDCSPDANDPNTARRQPKLIEDQHGGRVIELLNSSRFQMQLLSVKSKLDSDQTHAKQGFHHLFVKTGRVRVIYGSGQEYLLEQGRSALLPACLGRYELVNMSKEEVELIKSFII